MELEPPSTFPRAWKTLRPFPIGNRFYDWRYESEPEPHMNGRKV